MTNNSRNRVEERDINDLLDDIVLAEGRWASFGYQEGFSVGRKEGNQEGYCLGYEQGLEVGRELAEIYGKTVALQQLQHTTKVRGALKQLQEAIDKFPRENNWFVDIIGSLENIRVLYKRLCVMCSVQTSQNLNFTESKNLSF